MKKIAIIIVVVAAAVGAYFLFSNGKEKPVTYTTIPVQRGNINTTVTATGTLEAITQVDVGTQVSGKIAHIYVDYNRLPQKELRASPRPPREEADQRHGVRGGGVPLRVGREELREGAG